MASEESTAVCPRRYCRNSTGRKPPTLAYLRQGRPQRLHRWIRSIRPRPYPTFYFKDVLLPHGPWLYLPSGKQSRPSAADPVPGLGTPAGFDDLGVTRFNQQRFLLQLEFLDRELGRLLARLRQTGLFDRALLVATADHGYAWDIGVKDRRKVTPRNVDEIAPIPFFIKAPGQHEGRIEGAYARTIDIVPTMAAVLGARLGWRADGRSAFSRAIRRRRLVRLPTRDFRRIVRIGARALERRRRTNRLHRARLFGVGTESLYRVGPNRDLVGNSLARLATAPRKGVGARIAYVRAMRALRPSSRWLPTQVAGRIVGGRHGARRNLAVAVNGRVEAVGRTFYLRGNRSESFSMMVASRSLRAGDNDVRLFQVTGRGASRRLRLLARA